MVKIISERIASLSYKFAEENNILLLPVNIIKAEEVIKDDNDEKARKFLENLNTDQIPSTSVPSHGEMIKFLQKNLKKGDAAIFICVSSKLSNLYDRAIVAAKEIKKQGIDIRVFDTETAVSMEGMFIWEARQMAKKNHSIDEIWNHLQTLKEKELIKEYGVINTLKFLEKNGRIGKAKAWLANLFSFKPIISARNGVIEPIGKARTNTQALEITISKIKEDMARTNASKIKVMYDYGIDDTFLREEVDPRVRREFDVEVISFNQISIAIACHLGPEVWGVCAKCES